MKPHDPILIQQVANGVIVSPAPTYRQDTCSPTFIADQLVFQDPNDFRDFVLSHFNFAQPKDLMYKPQAGK
jgi:hypothetical protein